MENELLEHIIKTETLSLEMKNVVAGVIKYKARVILLLKTILLAHTLATCTLLYFNHETLSITNVLGIASVLINIGINISLLACIRIREKNLTKLNT